MCYFSMTVFQLFEIVVRLLLNGQFICSLHCCIFGRLFVKWFILCYCLSCLSVCNVGVLSQTVVWIKRQLGTEVDLGPGDVLIGTKLSPQKRAQHPPPLSRFTDGRRQACICINRGPCLLWPNGWMEQNSTWYRGRPRPRQHCVRWGPSSSSRKGVQQPPPLFISVCCGTVPISVTAELLLIVSRPSDHYFCSVCLFVSLFVCLFVQSFSELSLIRFRSN